MHPILFHIPGVDWPLRSFGLMVVIGFLLGAHLYSRLAERYRAEDEEDLSGYAALPVWALIGILVGARFLYVIVEILRASETGKAYLADPLRVFFYWEGGLVMYGGTFGALLACWWCCKKHSLRMGHAIDIGVVCSFAGLAVGRIGCLLVGDDYGSRVSAELSHLPFPLTIRVPEVLPEGSLFGADNAGQVLWATQPWMSFNALFLTVLGLYLMKRRRYEGQVTIVLLFVYSFGRYVIEEFRGDEVRGVWFGGALSTSQLISVVLAVVCGALLFRNRGRDDRDHRAPAEAAPAAEG